MKLMCGQLVASCKYEGDVWMLVASCKYEGDVWTFGCIM